MSKNTNIVEIAQAIEDKLVAKEIVDDVSQIIWAIEDFPEHIKGDFDIVLRINRDQNTGSQADGGGRIATWALQVIDVFVRSSFAGTPLGNDKDKIKKHVPIEQSVLDALEGKMLEDADGVDLLTKPIRWLGTTAPRKEASRGAKNLWQNTGMSFEFRYRPLIDPNDYT